MNCAELTVLLDERGIDVLGDADSTVRQSLAAHEAECAECHAMLLGLRSLAADPIPVFAVPAGRAPAAPAVRQRRGWHVGLAAVLGLGTGSAVFAVAAWYVVSGDPDGRGENAGAAGAETAPPLAHPAAPAGQVDAAAAMLSTIEAEEARGMEAWSAAILDALPDGDYFALLPTIPAYPEAAAASGLEGYAVSEFTITAAGDVENVSIVEASDPVFAAPTVEATRSRKYKPRVVDGQGVAVNGVRNRVVFRLAPPQDGDAAPGDAAGAETARATDTDPGNTAIETAGLDSQVFAAVLEPARACLDAGDLRCMELELDRILATYVLSPEQASTVWRFYGFLYHRRGRYELAIEAYRKAALPASGEPTYLNTLPLRIIAYIQYERQQYQAAMDAVTAYLSVADSVPAADYLFVEKLRSLGAIDPGQ